MSSRQSVMLDESGLPMLTGGPILGDVAREYGVSCAEITNGRRFSELVEARKECARRLYRGGLSVSDIGRVLKRHHSTVIHYLHWDDVVERKG